ncbi:ABC transporter permease [Ancylomarina longa]|uniref:ABC transporter permease n=1 Tax=Ancylomarina longa TaxID=2487017 RepID=A0A434AXU5_9BACT|nr:ABC transporter permease [Ancylomarina longa]RUT79375.1 ABC transporter permease [Ancylomarina longa]
MFKIFKYSFFDLIRSTWSLVYLLFFLVITSAILYMSGDLTKAIISMMNVILMLIPLVSTVFGAIYLYNSREFAELLLAQPIKRKSFFLGQYLGLSISLTVSFLIGVGLPFIFWGVIGSKYLSNFLVLMGVGLLLGFIFSLLSYWVALRFENRIKGFGFALFIWLFMSVIYDGIFLLILIWFESYPTENLAIILTLFNPIDLGRVLIMLFLDTSALMGYTGAVFYKFFGALNGILISSMTLFLWIIIPVFFLVRYANKKDF